MRFQLCSSERRRNPADCGTLSRGPKADCLAVQRARLDYIHTNPLACSGVARQQSQVAVRSRVRLCTAAWGRAGLPNGLPDSARTGRAPASQLPLTGLEKKNCKEKGWEGEVGAVGGRQHYVQFLILPSCAVPGLLKHAVRHLFRACPPTPAHRACLVEGDPHFAAQAGVWPPPRGQLWVHAGLVAGAGPLQLAQPTLILLQAVDEQAGSWSSCGLHF